MTMTRKAAITKANQEMGRLIKFYRQKRGLTQKALADKLGVHYITLHRWERGTGAMGMSVDDFIRLMAVLKIDADMLTGGIKL